MGILQVNTSQRSGPGWVLQALVAFVLFVAPSAGLAQVDRSYRIGPGDVLRIEVSSRPEAADQFTVAEGGTVTLPGIGAVRAAERTVAELEDDLSRRYSLLDRQIPRVRITVIESRSQQIAVLGAVLLPGLYTLSANATTWSAIELAGGASDDADLSAVDVVPSNVGIAAGRKTITVNVAAAIQSGSLGTLERLHPGDTVRVRRKGAGASGLAGMVYVFGAVGLQGAVPADQAPDLLTLVLRSGGPAGDADLSRVEIVRHDGGRYSHLRVDLQEYLNASNPAGTVGLQPGDTVYLPRHERRNYLLQALGIVSPVLGLTATVIALTRR